MCAWGIQYVLLFSNILSVFMSSHIFMFVCVPACTCVRLCMPCVRHVLYRTPVFVCMLVCECEETTEGRPTESTAFRKRCQNEFVTESVNLRRKGTAERERLSPGTQSLSD